MDPRTLTVLAWTFLTASGFAQEDPIHRILARVERGGIEEAWIQAQALADLGEEFTPSMRDQMQDADPLGQLTLSRALLELEETAEARDGLLALMESDADEEIRKAAVELLGSPEFLEDSTVTSRLRGSLEETFEPRVKILLAKSLYKVSPGDKVFCARLIEQWLLSDRRDLRVLGALALAEIGRFDRATRVLREIAYDPSPEGALARAYLEIADYQRELHREYQIEEAVPAIQDDALRLFQEVYELALARHIRGGQYSSPEDREKLISAAANGMLSALDPHSTFFTNDQHIEWNLELQRDYGGIGAYVDILNNVFTITRPIYGGPAYAAGLRSGDQIHEVDSWSTEGVTDIQQIIRRLKGPPGTPVSISVYRSGWPELKTFEMNREHIVIPSVNSEMLPGDIGYVEVMTFGRQTTEEFAETLVKLRDQGARGLIVDLRFNSGGYLETAIETVGILCGGDKLAVATMGTEKSEDREYRSHDHLPGFADARQLPLAVLINEYSASASEILAGNIRHHERGTIIGEHSYGKGSVQTQYWLPSQPQESFEDLNRNGIHDPGEPYEDRNQNEKWDPGPFVKVTTALYYLPGNEGELESRSGKEHLVSIDRQYDTDGKLTDRGGIAPDFEVEFIDRLRGKQVAVSQLFQKKTDDDRNIFEQYLDERYPQHQELFVQLSMHDNFDSSKYPDFDEFYESLETELDQDDVRYLLRISLRKKISDEMVRQKSFPFPGSFVWGDFQEDAQLQAAIQTVLKDLEEKPEDHSEYSFFDVAMSKPEETTDEVESGS